jgi:adenine-specific DNA-methyltransferase
VRKFDFIVFHFHNKKKKIKPIFLIFVSMEKSTIQIAFEQTQELIKHFEAGIEHYLSPSYQEAEVRKEYIDKFYTFLGWDVNHDHQKNPFAQEVKIEKAQRQQGGLGQKRADYAFFLEPNFKQEQFFVEAKKPSRTLRQNKDDYFQTAKYGWNAGTGVSILTDFEEIVIVDCRFRPDFDTILQSEIKYYKYKDFQDFDTFEEFYWLFSREALVSGNLATYIGQLKKPKGTGKQLKIFGEKYQSIDESFLNYIDAKRFELATAFYQNNHNLDAYELTEATQRTIDRIVFIRFLEDKLIETENIIHNIATANHPWAKFVEYSKHLETKYNGIVFKPLFIDDKKFGGANDDLFRALCSDLDHTNTPYDFNYIPIHILGSIYERFLGKVVVIQNDRATIEVKPEVRKAGGVFYTPKYIVDYIVKNTVGKLIENKTPKQIAELTFADIACGSGSFLIGVFEYLLDYHNKWYNENPVIAKKDGCKYNEDFGIYVLSIHQKQHILLNNIYGVDIDLQATEVTQLSLFLKMLEDETTSTASDMMVLFHEKILPNLSNNIKCGNSLIGTDILNTKLDLDLEQERKLNPFDFKLAFPKVFKKGGFDAIVGNPPYGNVSENYINNKYFHDIKIVHNSIDLYLTFILKALNISKSNAPISFIIPTTWLYMSQYSDFRNKLIKKCYLEEIIYFKKSVFKDATVETSIFNILNRSNLINEDYTLKLVEDTPELFNYVETKIKFEKLKDIDNFVISDIQSTNLFNKIKKKSNTLDLITNVVCGLTPYRLGKGSPKQTTEIVDNRSYDSNSKIDETYLQYIMGRDFNRYTWNILEKRFIKYGNCLAEPRMKAPFFEQKIVIRQTADSIIANLDDNHFLSLKNVHNLKCVDKNYSLKFILGILNSSTINWWYQKLIPESGRVFAEVKVVNLKQLPIPKLNKSNQETHDSIANLVEQMLTAKNQQKTAVTERDKSYLEEKCKNLDSQINDLVYELYELTDEEIEIIENA